MISALTEGMSIRSIERQTGIHRDTIMRLGLRIGQACAGLHDRTMHSLNVNRIEIDEVWSYVGSASGGRCREEPVTGTPDRAHISTSYVERMNLTMRMGMRRFTRLTNAFSRKIDNHIYALSLYFVWHNFVQMHSTPRMSPAMAAGVSKHLWSMNDIVALVDARAPRPAKRGPYRKKVPGSQPWR